ncbi:SCAN domain-containing protein 3 [Oopsacas minuta]|uniref:SCAN domain-containing protein 3 n=1 Tax=Oopsacas minuta TaxID=111878 RepID=A0AAV7JVK1_9METZ|nr:SCAN domain-containing protein 3 [Oopsacas minuta]
MASCGKKRKYLDDHIKYVFTKITKNGIELPQCVICYKTSCNDAMCPSRLKRHLSTVHSDLLNKSKDYFAGKSISLKRVRSDRNADFHQGLKKVVEASYEISLLIVRTKNHTQSETLVKPCILSAAKLVLGEDSYQKLSEILLSDPTVKYRIDEMADDVKIQVLEKVRSSPSSQFSVTRLQMYLSALNCLYMHGSLKWDPGGGDDIMLPNGDNY